MSEKPDPPIPADVDLKDYQYTPIYRARLFGSSFHARASDAEWRAGVTLWLKSQDQVPAGSLPKDDIDLCRLAELGRDLKTWRKLKPGALHGWYECSDGRLYNVVVSEVVTMQWAEKIRRRWMTDCARVKKYCQRHKLAFEAPSFEEWSSQGGRCNVPGTDGQCPEDIDEMSPRTDGNVPRENGSKRREVKGSEASPTGLCSKSEREESVAAGERKDEGLGNPVVRLSPPPQALKPEAVRENIKKQLVQKCMRYCNARMRDDEKTKAVMGLMGEDPNNDAQWWLDEIDRRRKREKWDDTREWKQKHLRAAE